MPLEYDDEPGSWGRLSEGWPETPHTAGKWLLCTKTEIVPYGSYVVVGVRRVDPDPGRPTYMRMPDERPYYDYSDAVIRIENEELKAKLEKAHHSIFELGRKILIDPHYNGEFAPKMDNRNGR